MNLIRMERTSVNLFCCMALDCDKVYRSKFNLKRHVEIAHLKIKRFECELCHGMYSSLQNLKEHRNLHSGLKPFVCSVCKETFRQASQLSLHKRVHMRPKPDHPRDLSEIDTQLRITLQQPSDLLDAQEEPNEHSFE